MPVLVRAHIDRAAGTALLRFPYHKETIATVKTFPGARWNPDVKGWTVPINLLPVISRVLVIDPVIQAERRAPIPPSIGSRLRPYQLTAAEHLIRNRGFLLTMEQRTGKTPVLIGAATALVGAGQADAVVVAYPAGVRWTWQEQLKAWANVDLVCLEGRSKLSDEQIGELWMRPYLFIGCHFDILGDHESTLHRVLAGKRYIVIIDEGQHLQNRKIARTKTAFALSHGLEAHARWYSQSTEIIERGPFDIMHPRTGEVISVPEGTPIASWLATGTLMRNSPRNIWAPMHFTLQGCVSSYQKFTARYCDGHNDDLGHWDDSGSSNEDELALRVEAMSYRVTRAEVAEWLPKSDRKVIKCSMPAKALEKYRRLERHYAGEARAAIDSDSVRPSSEAALRSLVQATSAAKVPTVVDRAYEHTERGVKVLCFAHFHETLSNLEDEFARVSQQSEGLPPYFCAGGWKTPAKRKEIIEQWRACPGPAILLLNTMSSGTGIDLADAEVALFLELEWVPADFRQAEDRIQDIHLGKRKTPPIYEYFLVEQTVDEAMAKAMLDKIRVIEAVTGKDVETGGVATTLRGADVVGSARLGLPDTSRDTVLAALASITMRWGEISDDSDAGNVALAADLGDAFGEDDEEQHQPTDGDENIPF